MRLEQSLGAINGLVELVGHGIDLSPYHRFDLGHVGCVQPGARDDGDEVRVELLGVEQTHEEALALRAREARGHLEARRLHSPEIGLGFSSKDAGIDASEVHLDDLKVRHGYAPRIEVQTAWCERDTAVATRN